LSDAELPANDAHQRLRDLAMTGHGGTSSTGDVLHDAVAAALAEQDAPLGKQMT
jgi:hypothetical protein